MRLDFTIAGTASGHLTDVTDLKIEGKPYDAGTPPPPPPSAEKVAPIQFSGDELGAAVLRCQPVFAVIADVAISPDDAVNVLEHKLPGSGNQLPALAFETYGPLKYMRAKNPEHPYWTGVVAGVQLNAEKMKALTDAAPVAHAVASGGYPDGLGGTTTADKAWETGVTTTDPDSVNLLLSYVGTGTVAMQRAKQRGNIYTYVRRFGRQAPDPAPRWPSGNSYSDAQIAWMQQLPQEYVDALLAGNDPGAPSPYPA